MEPITAIINLASTLMNKIWGNKDEELKQKFLLDLKVEAAKLEIFKGQMDVNKAEASNPNRKWVTWRECLGYLVVTAFAYQWVILPIVTTIAVAIGSPLDTSKIFQVEILDIIYLMCGMLGMDAAPLIANKIRGRGVK